MWFLTARKARRTPITRGSRGTFRPRLEALEDRCLMSAGALDTTFNSPTGQVITAVDHNPLSFAPEVVYPNTNANPATDGKIVTGGEAIGSNGKTDFALTRYNADGTLDKTFGKNGIVTTVIGTNLSYINALALQSDGKTVAAGVAYYQNTGSFAFTVARYTTTGTLDSSFGSGGIVQTFVPYSSKRNSGGYDIASAVAIDAFGRIVVGGYADQSVDAAEDFTLLRYTSSGALDTTFGPNKNGISITPNFGSVNTDGANGLAIYPNTGTPNDGKIVLSGSTNSTSTQASSMAVARYTKDGLLDTSFNSGGANPGIVWGLAPSGSTGAIGRGAVIQNTGAIVVAGFSFFGSIEQLTLVRLAGTGQLDKAFGGSNTGFALNSNATEGKQIVQGPNGDLLTATIVAAGTPLSSGTDDLAVAAYLPDGTPDTTFGTGGIATVDFAGGRDRGRGIAVQGDGKILVAGVTTPPGGSTSYVCLARFLPPDTKIGSFTGSSAAGNVTLTASNILNSNPTSSIKSVNFYLQNPDLTLTLLGTGTNSSGTWTLTFAEATYGLTAGNTYTFVAQAMDSNGVLSDPLAISFQVM